MQQESSPDPQYQIRDKRTRLASGFLVLIIVLLSVVPTLISLRALSIGDDLITKIRPLIDSSNRFGTLMSDQETGQRGYILTSKEQFLEPYNAGRSDLAKLWLAAEEQALVIGGQAPTLLAQVKSDATAWQAQFGERDLQLVKAGKADQAEAEVGSGAGKVAFDRFRASNIAFGNHLAELRTQMIAERNNWVLAQEISIIFLGIIGLLAVGLLYYINNISRQYLVETVRLAEATRARDDLLSVARHELRTPITSIKGYSQMVMRRLRRQIAEGNTVTLKRDDWDKITSHLDTIDQQSGRLERMVEELLDVNRMLDRDDNLQRTATDLVRLCQHVLDELRPLSPNHQLELESGEGVTAMLDANRMERVLYNLVGNAIKYSPDGGKVTLSLRRMRQDVVCTVSDAGLGVPAAEQERLFQRFYRASNVGSGATKISGFGLGLYVSKRIIEQHGGRIWMNSEEGRGSQFAFSLPL